jgi:hypothetical protein
MLAVPSPLAVLQRASWKGADVPADLLAKEITHLKSLKPHIRTIDIDGMVTWKHLPNWFTSDPDSLVLSTVRWVDTTTQRRGCDPPAVPMGFIPVPIDLLVLKGDRHRFSKGALDKPRFTFRSPDAAMVAIRLYPSTFGGYLQPSHKDWKLYNVADARICLIFMPNSEWKLEHKRGAMVCTSPTLTYLAYQVAYALVERNRARFTFVNVDDTVSTLATEDTMKALVGSVLLKCGVVLSADELDSAITFSTLDHFTEDMTYEKKRLILE